jgi:hypothetical protein
MAVQDICISPFASVCGEERLEFREWLHGIELPVAHYLLQSQSRVRRGFQGMADYQHYLQVYSTSPVSQYFLWLETVPNPRYPSRRLANIAKLVESLVSA